MVRADKGGATVFLYKNDYDRKIYDLLDDTTTLKITRSDPTKKLQVQNNDIVKKMC